MSNRILNYFISPFRRWRQSRLTQVKLRTEIDGTQKAKMQRKLQSSLDAEISIGRRAFFEGIGKGAFAIGAITSIPIAATLLHFDPPASPATKIKDSGLTESRYENLLKELRAIRSSFPEQNYGTYPALETGEIIAGGVLRYKGTIEEILRELLAATGNYTDRVLVSDLPRLFQDNPYYQKALERMTKLKGVVCGQIALITMLRVNKLLIDMGLEPKARILFVFLKEKRAGTLCNHFIVKASIEVEGEEKDIFIDSTPFGSDISFDPSNYIIQEDRTNVLLSDYLESAQLRVINTPDPLMVVTLFRGKHYRIVQLLTGSYFLTSSLGGLGVEIDTLLIGNDDQVEVINKKSYLIRVMEAKGKMREFVTKLRKTSSERIFDICKEFNLPTLIKDTTMEIYGDSTPEEFKGIIEDGLQKQEWWVKRSLYYYFTKWPIDR